MATDGLGVIASDCVPHQVPIHSLPEEWLWCESWCGNASQAAAKTIDLCNNPMTKEPKLEQVRHS